VVLLNGKQRLICSRVHGGREHSASGTVENTPEGVSTCVHVHLLRRVNMNISTTYKDCGVCGVLEPSRPHTRIDILFTP
jgi:hypothetical protein